MSIHSVVEFFYVTSLSHHSCLLHPSALFSSPNPPRHLFFDKKHRETELLKSDAVTKPYLWSTPCLEPTPIDCPTTPFQSDLRREFAQYSWPSIYSAIFREQIYWVHYNRSDNWRGGVRHLPHKSARKGAEFNLHSLAIATKFCLVPGTNQGHNTIRMCNYHIFPVLLGARIRSV